MAADDVTEITKRQPNGPDYLCGYFSGGLVAFEIARRLSESGDEVGLVGVFESPARWPLPAWRCIIAGALHSAPAAVRATPIRTWPSTLGKTAERLRVWRGTLGAASQIHVVLNWSEELKAKVPAK